MITICPEVLDWLLKIRADKELVVRIVQDAVVDPHIQLHHIRLCARFEHVCEHFADHGMTMIHESVKHGQNLATTLILHIEHLNFYVINGLIF